MLLKIDACTVVTLRGRYARVCVELHMDKPVAKSINIEDHKQLIEYEDDKILCKNCGLLGHTMYLCSMAAISAVQVKGNKDESNEADLGKVRNEEGWHTVSFQKTKRMQKKITKEDKENSADAGIDVKIFNAATGKFIQTQKLKFVHKDNCSLSPTQYNPRLAKSTNTDMGTTKGNLNQKNHSSTLGEEHTISETTTLITIFY